MPAPTKFWSKTNEELRDLVANRSVPPEDIQDLLFELARRIG